MSIQISNIKTSFKFFLFRFLNISLDFESSPKMYTNKTKKTSPKIKKNPKKLLNKSSVRT